MTEVIVRIAHIRAADLCMSGTRRWFETHGFSWNEFLEKGKSADELEATGDGLAFRVTAIARSEIQNG